MKYLLVIVLILPGYYAFTYGTTIYKEDNNKLGGCAAIAIALIGTIVPIIFLFMKNP